MKYDIIAFVIKARERLYADKTLDVYIVIDGYLKYKVREKSTISLSNFSDNRNFVFVSYKRYFPGILGLNSGR